MDSDFESDATEGDKSSGSSSLASSPSDGGRRAALYARVSTDEERQTTKTQLFRLREYAGHRGFSIAGEYVDIGSGLNPDRPEYQRLIGDARQRAFDVVIVWRYDRLARSTQALIDALKEFQALGVEFISHQEQIDTTTPQGEMVFGFIASLAQFESRLISQRVKAGMQRAKEEGKDVGRPSIAEEKQKKIRRLYSEEDVSISQVAEQVGVAYGTAWNYVQDIEGD